MKDGGPAFPCNERVSEYRDGRYEDVIVPMGGMSLRDHFAGQALSGLLASTHPDHSAPTWEAYAACAYGHADAMLSEREKNA
jgi:hypothetical protein